MKGQRWMVLLVCLILLLSVTFSGCGNTSPSSNNAGTKTAAENGAAPAAASPAAAVTTVSAAKPVPISIIAEDYARVFKKDDPVVALIEKNTNTKITLTIYPAAEYLSKVNLLIASDSLPDIIRFAGYNHFQYLKEDIFLELSSLMKDYPDIKKSQAQAAWDKVTVNGKIYAIPCYNVPGKYSYYIRQDWLDNLGLKAPKNLDELRTVLKAFTYNDPDKNGKNDTYGIGNTVANFQVVTLSSFMPVFGAFGMQPTYYYEDGGKVIGAMYTDKYRDAIEYCRKLYMDDKVCDPDMFVMQRDQMVQNFANSKFGSSVGWWAFVCEELFDRMKMNQLNPNAKFVIANDIKGPNGNYGMLSNNSVSLTTSVSKTSKVSKEALSLLNYLATDEGFMLSCYGIKGVHYTVDDKGNYVGRTPEGTQAMNDKWLDVMSQFVYRLFDYQELLLKSNPSYRYYNETTRDSKLYPNLFEGFTTPEMQKYASDLNKIQAEWFVAFVTGKKPLSQFSDYVKEYKTKGGDAVTDSLIKAYNERYGKSLAAGN